ncbi:integrase core domain-containing protein [Dyadobacter frigoris]|uniref:Transposase n=1 Tax=Dyadobacter frigoris TaxID=2576211 RepID=A0A4U6D4M7_9BACT|nr:transposase [Dyadobacter frigoris]
MCLFSEYAQQKIEIWRNEYNSFRLHSSLGGLTPDEFERQAKNKEREKVRNGVFNLDDHYYASSGGILLPSGHYTDMFR